MNKMKIDTLIALLEDLKENLVSGGKPLYVEIAGEIRISSNEELTQIEATI